MSQILPRVKHYNARLHVDPNLVIRLQPHPPEQRKVVIRAQHHLKLSSSIIAIIIVCAALVSLLIEGGLEGFEELGVLVADPDQERRTRRVAVVVAPKSLFKRLEL